MKSVGKSKLDSAKKNLSKKSHLMQHSLPAETQDHIDLQADLLDPTLQTVLDKLAQVKIHDETQGDLISEHTALDSKAEDFLIKKPPHVEQVEEDEGDKPSILSHFKLSSPLSSPLFKKLRLSLHRDSNLETPLQPKPRRQTYPATTPLFTLMFDASTSNACNPVAEMIFQREREKYNGSTFYRLIKHDDDTCHLQSNHSATSTIPNSTYAYVIMEKTNGDLELRLGKKNHFYVAEKSYHEVVAAGEIKFSQITPDSAKVDWITDFSGGYHLQEKDPDLLAAKRESIKLAIIKVGLPLDKFHFFKAEDTTKQGRYSP